MPEEAKPAQLPSLLLIDDDAISREVLSILLEARGFMIDTADNGADALAKLDTAQPEIILMDTQMPGLSGLALIAALREATRARIVAISGSAVDASILEATDGFLLKPIEADDLVALLADLPASNNPGAGRHDLRDSDETTSVRPSTPVIDPAVLGRLRGMMSASAVREIYDAVTLDLAKRLVLLESAMNKQDSEEVSRIAHAIKGGSAMVGFSAAGEPAARLETSNRSDTWREELSQLRFALSALERILEDEFQT
jgi:CheY-like chemotaxis protein